MGKKIKLGDNEYDVENLSAKARANVVALQFADNHIAELTNMQILLNCAKNSYVQNLKKEMLSDKAGFYFDDD